MGLDNIPMTYPCKKENTAILNEEGQIDCKQTIEAHQCPYQREKENDPIIKDISPTYGMFGTDCWYRGKYGNYLLSEMKIHNDEFPYDENGFYGDINESGQGGISEDECLKMSESMVEFTESWVHYVRTASDRKNAEDQKTLINDWIYAAWWLKFVGNYADGSEIWY